MGFLRTLVDLFGHRDAAVPAPPDSDSWRAGDLAECIHRGPWFSAGIAPHFNGPQLGEIRVVDAVEEKLNGDTSTMTFLSFARWRPRCFSALGFRKVTPRADALERAEPEFIGLLDPARRAPAREDA